ncbi:MAG TPA: hypothetical protein ENH60_01745 [Pricia sp.]|nr:hypothetical protein [Pricia sp.]
MIQKAGDNNVIFKVDRLFTDKVKVKGKKLFFDPSFDPQRHTQTWGEVVQIPLKLTGLPIMQEDAGTPPYHERGTYRYKFVSDIEQEIKIGDKVYFHFNTMLSPNNQIKTDRSFTGSVKSMLFKVRYDQVLAAIRYTPAEKTMDVWNCTMRLHELRSESGETIFAQLDGDNIYRREIIPIGSYALIRPDMESWDEIIVPTYFTSPEGKVLKDKFGKKIEKPREKWLQIKQAPEAKHLLGFVEHIGSPLRGDKRQVNPGDHIYYRHNADWVVNIEGEDYYMIRQRHIIAKKH